MPNSTDVDSRSSSLSLRMRSGSSSVIDSDESQSEHPSGTSRCFPGQAAAGGAEPGAMVGQRELRRCRRRSGPRLTALTRHVRGSRERDATALWPCNTVQHFSEDVAQRGGVARAVGFSWCFLGVVQRCATFSAECCTAADGYGSKAGTPHVQHCGTLFAKCCTALASSAVGFHGVFGGVQRGATLFAACCTGAGRRSPRRFRGAEAPLVQHCGTRLAKCSTGRVVP